MRKVLPTDTRKSDKLAKPGETLKLSPRKKSRRYRSPDEPTPEESSYIRWVKSMKTRGAYLVQDRLTTPSEQKRLVKAAIRKMLAGNVRNGIIAENVHEDAGLQVIDELEMQGITLILDRYLWSLGQWSCTLVLERNPFGSHYHGRKVFSNAIVHAMQASAGQNLGAKIEDLGEMQIRTTESRIREKCNHIVLFNAQQNIFNCGYKVVAQVAFGNEQLYELEEELYYAISGTQNVEIAMGMKGEPRTDAKADFGDPPLSFSACSYFVRDSGEGVVVHHGPLSCGAGSESAPGNPRFDVHVRADPFYAGTAHDGTVCEGSTFNLGDVYNTFKSRLASLSYSNKLSRKLGPKRDWLGKMLAGAHSGLAGKKVVQQEDLTDGEQARLLLWCHSDLSGQA